MRTCKFPDEDCVDRYLKQGHKLICRLDEWKKKHGTCPYNSEIKSRMGPVLVRNKKDRGLIDYEGN